VGRKNSRSEKLTVYVAGPLFTQAERKWNAELVRRLRVLKYGVILPQEGARQMLNGSERFNPHKLFTAAVDSIERCNIVIAVLDGADPDSGTCWECGYAWKAGRPIIGLRTDLRPGGDDLNRPVNLMLSRSCSEFIAIEPSEVSIRKVVKLVHEAVQKVVTRTRGR
jgi:nucleoside 2-deoxyribosyltransferase